MPLEIEDDFGICGPSRRMKRVAKQMSFHTLHLTVGEFDKMVRLGAFDDVHRKIELFRGELIEMNPAGPVHDDLIIYLNNWSMRVVDSSQTLVTSQTGLDLPEQSSRPEPDLMWIGSRRYRDGHPRASDVQLAIEVSDSSLEKDIQDKGHLYAEAGIIEYWIVDTQSNLVHVYRRPSANGYQERLKFGKGDFVSPSCRESAVLNVDELFGC